MAKTGRNEPCTCGKTGPDGNRLKFKRCCGAPQASTSANPESREIPPELRASPEQQRRAQEMFREMQSKDRIRRTQQGGGKPIISTEFGKHRVVAVGNKVFFDKQNGTFVDFLLKYMATTLGKEWCDAELAKPYSERHTLMQWHEDVRRYQVSTSTGAVGKVINAEMTGAVAAFVGLAHALYRLEHNAKMQERLIKHLKTPDLFQGAYYEAMVASIVVTADFEITPEDETDGNTKHCEFAARSRATGQTFHVEAKMRGVSGIMGKGPNDGAKDDKDPTSKVVTHVAAALKKPAKGQRVIFVDLNGILPPDASLENKPDFIDAAIKKLEKYARTDMPKGSTAYVYITSSSFHRDLNGPPRMMAYMYGLGLDDFNDLGPMRPAERYRKERPHRDAIAIGKAITQFLRVPTTFDGSLPSETFGGRTRPIIGQRYNFVRPPFQAIAGTLIAGSVDEAAKKMTLHLMTDDGQRITTINDMTDDQLHDYRDHRADFFGGHAPQRTVVNTPDEIFEWAMNANAGTARDLLLDAMANHPLIEEIRRMSDDDVRAEHAEWVTRIMVTRSEQAKKAKSGK